jgi:hypothetical protein
MANSRARWTRTLLALAAVISPAAPLTAQSTFDRLSIHGYLTQAYAASDSHQVMGIPHGGTFDYRRAALLLRFKGTPNDAFVVQLANRELGESPSDNVTSEVQMDWAFYERRFGSKTTLRVGKAPIPEGIFNETRYVGTLLPFYRAPFGFYQEGAFVSETLNGLVLTRTLVSSGSWGLTGSAFAGEFDNLQSGVIFTGPDTPPEFVVVQAKTKNLLGAQFWLQTPVTGLRLGLGGERHDDRGLFANHDAAKDWWGSVDGVFNRFTTRAEYRYIAFGANSGYLQTYYGQVGFRILDALVLNVQRDVMDLQLELPTGKKHVPFTHDNAIGINYEFSQNIVAKLEVHDNDGYNFEEVVNLFGAPLESRYVLASISVSF